MAGWQRSNADEWARRYWFYQISDGLSGRWSIIRWKGAFWLIDDLSPEKDAVWEANDVKSGPWPTLASAKVAYLLAISSGQMETSE